MYTPTLRQQIALLDSAGPSSYEYQAMSRRGQIVGIALAIVVLVVVFLMVVKPTI